MGRLYKGSKTVRLTEAQRTLIIAYLIGKPVRAIDLDERMAVVKKMRSQSIVNQTHHVPSNEVNKHETTT